MTLKQQHSTGEGLEPVRHPPELWQLVGDYILPEDISRFGAICHDTYDVVNSPSFWIKLYKDFYHIDRHTQRIEGNQVYKAAAVP